MAGKISKTRVISGVVLVILALAVIIPGGSILAITLYLLSNIAFIELTRACGIHGKEQNTADGTAKKYTLCDLQIVGMLGILCYYLVIFFGQTQVFFMTTLILLLMALMFVYVFSFPKYTANQIMTTYFSFVYAPVMLSFIYLTRCVPHGVYIVWMIFISSWICDTCAYFTGVLIGKHKMTPKLSPKKTIEGAIGGIAGSALVGGLFGWFLVDRVSYGGEFIWIMAMIGGVGAVISQVGDLAASAIKRNHDIKDYGKLIPGHGGIMDRFDSVIFTAPMVYFLVMLLLK